MEQERIMNRLMGFYGSKLPEYYKKGYKIYLNQLIDSVKEECAKKADSVQNPYPKSIFPMDTEGYKKAIPDEHLRTAISGYCGRMFFDIAKKEIVEAIRDKE